MLSKSEFLRFRECEKSFWLKARKPDAIDWPAPPAFVQMLMRDGYAVEREVEALVANWPAPENYSFQHEFEAGGLHARADLVRWFSDGSIDLYEIKGSTSMKQEPGRDYIADAGFQLLAARAAGYTVGKVFLIHVNGAYVRQGPIDPAALVAVVDVTQDVHARLQEVETSVAAALALLDQDTINEDGCTCVDFGSADRRCASFDYFNNGIPEQSIYLLPRIRADKIAKFRAEGRIALIDVREDELSDGQKPVWRAARQGAPIVNLAAIGAFLSGFQQPLHFYDFETFGSAVPAAEGHKPFGGMPVQYSLHILDGDVLSHFEYLTADHGQQRKLIEHMEASFGAVGTIICWNKSTEMACNRRMAELHPEKTAFLEGLNARTVDLMDPFKQDYVDIRFEGSTSIKKVLPVLCPELEYDQSAVHDGTGAMEAWLKMIETADNEERSRCSAELLSYCRLDTLAMVEIYKKLASLA